MILLGIDHIQHSLVGDPKRRGISGGKKLKIHSNVLFLICRIWMFLFVYQKKQFNFNLLTWGQKKRVNIGMEIVAYTSMIFLDEP